MNIISNKSYNPNLIPPICVVDYTEIVELTSLIENTISNGNFLVRLSMENEYIVVYPQSTIDHQKIVAKFIADNELKFYTHTPVEEKTIPMILKGVKREITEKEIENELKGLKIPEVDVIKVSKYIYDKKKPDKYYLLVQMRGNKEELRKIKTLAGQRIKWQSLKKDVIVQCTNCQRTNHISKNCYSPFRCVKCAGSHEKNACPIKKDSDKSKLKCANCGEYGHPANYGGCIYLRSAKLIMTGQKGKVQDLINKEKEKKDKEALLGQIQELAITK